MAKMDTPLVDLKNILHPVGKDFKALDW